MTAFAKRQSGKAARSDSRRSSRCLGSASCWPGLRAENWPRFRGPTGQGISLDASPPLHWSESENIVWKTDIAGEGWSSPIVWSDRIFLTATTDAGTSCHVICVSRDDGKVLWDVEAFKQTPTKKEDRNSYATSTPVTDGQHVFAFFSSGKAVAMDFDGKIAWKDEDLHFYSVQGLGVSPILYSDLLIMPWDHSSEEGPCEPGWIKPWDKSYVLALDKETGKVRYKAMRGMTRSSHATPLVIDVEGHPELISPAGDFVQAFDPDNGQKLWEVANKGETPVPSVVYGDGLIFTTSGFEDPTIRATRPASRGGSGTSAAKVIWENRKAVPMMPSFLFTDHLLFTVKESGVGLCLEAATGKVIWQERIGESNSTYSASPLLAGGKIYYPSEQGETTVIEPGREFKQVARNRLLNATSPETFKASIAVSAGRFFIRSDKHLYCIEEKRL